MVAQEKQNGRQKGDFYNNSASSGNASNNSGKYDNTNNNNGNTGSWNGNHNTSINNFNTNNINNGNGNAGAPKRLGSTGRSSNNTHKFVSPLLGNSNCSSSNSTLSSKKEEAAIDPRLKNIDPQMVETILNEVMDISSSVTWSDICGLEHAKKSIQEIVVLPMLRPDIFTGLRSPPKGLLLFGPPGTGKTLIGKCIAAQSKATFFSISSSSLTSKWTGEVCYVYLLLFFDC